MIIVLHAYSRANAGDGLLVDLTLERLSRIGVSASDCALLALDSDSFGDLPTVVKVGTAGRSFDAELVRAIPGSVGMLAGSLHPRIGFGSAQDTIAAADALVAVGGGYLRAGNRINSLGTAVNHLGQLRAASRAKAPSIYLPQSIGPLTGPVGSALRTALRGIDVVHVRDDRSTAVLDGLSNVRRTPDLAVLDLAERLSDVPQRPAGGRPVLVARGLANAPDYVARLHSLASRLGAVFWAVQTEGSGSKSDRKFYGDAGFMADGRLTEVLSRDETGPVVSVRLHGALQALLAGVPAVHLGYERKSWGAYHDLGLGEWVHSARRFDPERVAAQVEELRQDPRRFWSAIFGRRAALLQDSERLTRSLQTTLDGG